jgi:hypothetical protein
MSIELLALLEDQKVLESNPFMGRHPNFDQNTFSDRLANKLKIQISQFEITQWHTLSHQQAKEELTSYSYQFPIRVAPLKGIGMVATSEENIQSLLDFYFNPTKPLIDSVKEAFLLFFQAQCMHALSGCAPFETFNLTQIDQSKLKIFKHSPSFVTAQACLSFTDFNIDLMLILDHKLTTSWRQWWLQHPFISINSNMAKKLPIQMNFTVGQVQLTPNELESVNEGDWIALDECSANESTSNCQVRVQSNGIDIAEGHFEQNQVKITRKLSDCFDNVKA